MARRVPKSAQKAPEEVLEQLLNPAYFADKVLGINLYKWQKDVLADIEPIDSRVALRAANGSGKTSTVISGVLIWHALVYQRSVAVTTAGVFRQVESQLWPSLRSHIAKLGGPWEVTSGEIRYLHPNGNTSRIIGYSATDPGRAEGWHAENHETAPLLMVVDEAKTVADPLFEAISRCQPTRLLIASSPGGSSGAFYRAFTKEADMWKRHAVTAFDCPHITQKQIDEVIQRYGEKHPLTRSMIYG